MFFKENDSFCLLNSILCTVSQGQQYNKHFRLKSISKKLKASHMESFPSNQSMTCYALGCKKIWTIDFHKLVWRWLVTCKIMCHCVELVLLTVERMRTGEPRLWILSYSLPISKTYSYPNATQFFCGELKLLILYFWHTTWVPS